MNWIGHELVQDALTELRDETYQRRVWTAAEGPEVGSLTEAVARLYDDSGLSDAFRAGRNVYGPHVDGSLREFSRLLRKIDAHRAPEEILQDPLLEEVRRRAGSILRELGVRADTHPTEPN